MEETKTKTLNLSIECRAYYNSHIEVPIEGHLEYISGSDVLDIDNCNFNE